MRSSFGEMLTEGGQIVGVSLGNALCAEHERGIEGLQMAFGIPSNPSRRFFLGDLVGSCARLVRKIPRGMVFANFGENVYLFFSTFNYGNLDAEKLDRILDCSNENKNLSTAWSDTDFGIRAKTNSEEAVALRQIYKAILKKDAMMYLCGLGNPLNPFGRRECLEILIKSRAPAGTLAAMREADEEYLAR